MFFINILVAILILTPNILWAQELPVYSGDEEQVKKANILDEILPVTYENNSTILAAREKFLSAKEKLEQAKAGYRPTVSANLDTTHSRTDTKGTNAFSNDDPLTSKTASLDIKQPVYRGGRTQKSVTRAESYIAYEQFVLSDIEQEILYEAVAAYMDLQQAQAVLDLHINNENIARKELEQAQNRFTVGEITRTDVSQSESRLAEAQAGVIEAKAFLQTALANYEQIVAAPPPAIWDYPVIGFDMPDDIEEAINWAQTNNRKVLQAQYLYRIAKEDNEIIKGELLPEVNALGSLVKAYDPSNLIDEQNQMVIGLSASIPLYQGGAVQSRMRESQKIGQQREQELRTSKEKARQSVIRDWELWQAAQAEVKARLSQVDAAKVAQEGMQIEKESGLRTTLDSLNTNKELLAAQVALVSARRNEVVSQFALARTIGLLVPQNLGFSSKNL